MKELTPDERMYLARCQTAVRAGTVLATVYKNGAKITGWPQRWPYDPSRRPKRGIVRSQTTRSLIRAAFNIGNAECEWGVMITLTFRIRHAQPKTCLRNFLGNLFNDDLRGVPLAWVQEYQERGVVHYHVLTTTAYFEHAVQVKAGEWAKRRRKGRTVECLQGESGDFVGTLWMTTVKDFHPDTLRFNCGGIVEKLSHVENVGLYLGSYVGKLAQKTLPDDEVPCGRWWWMSPSVAPRPRKVVRVVSWDPLKRPASLIYDTNRCVCLGVLEGVK